MIQPVEKAASDTPDRETDADADERIDRQRDHQY